MATGLLVLPWWNRFLGLSLDGYMPWFGHRILAGEIPYRDFFLHLPPLQPLAEAALEAVVGKSIVAARAVAALARLAMAGAAAFWLARSYRPSAAILGSVAAIALASSDDTEILDLYNPHAAFAALVSGLCAALALDRGRRAPLLGWLSGAAAGVAFWTKQTVGLGATVAVPVALALFALRDVEDRTELRRLSGRYAAGWGVVALAIGGWLATHGALDDFVRQVFADAAGSKGSPLRLLLRPWLAPFELPGLRGAASWALALALVVVAGARLRLPSEPATRSPWRSCLLGGVSAVAAIAVTPFVIELAGGTTAALNPARATRFFGVFYSLYGLTFLGLLSAVAACRRPLRRDERHLALFVLVAGAIALTQSISFAATGAAAFPALALMTAHGAGGDARPARWLKVPVLAAAAVALVASTAILRRGAFDFAGWREPAPHESRVTSTEPALDGLVLSPGTVRTVDGILAALRRATDPGEAVLTYPVYPIFHWLADRPPATFASLHWIDVTPDHVVDDDLARILARPPVAVVRQWIPDHVFDVNERYFRAGHESALRRMNRELDALLDARYRKVFVSPNRRNLRLPRLEVWVLAERAAARGIPVRD